MDISALKEQYPLLVTLAIIAVILLLTWIAERLLYRIVRRLGQHDANPLPSSSIFANIVRVCVWLVGVGVILRICFGIDITALIAALGVGGIAISLGFQDTLANLFGGLQVSLGRLVEPGQYIEVLGQAGLVRDVTWRHTAIVDVDGDLHMVPNSLINKNTLVWLDPWDDVYTDFILPVGIDLEVFCAEVLPRVSAALEGRLAEGREPLIQFSGSELGGISGHVKTSVLRSEATPRQARDIVTRAIDSALRAAGPAR